jgi:hypothetical protein
MLNGNRGEQFPAAVLIQAIQPTEGIDVMQSSEPARKLQPLQWAASDKPWTFPETRMVWICADHPQRSLLNPT